MAGTHHDVVAPSPVASQPTASKPASGIRDRVLSVLLQVAYFRFRYDIFISYRRHYKSYVTTLKQQLEHVGYRAFFDGEECPPGSALNQTLHSALARSAALVVVGSHDVDSPYVTMEVTTFGTTGRSIIPIDIDGALSACRMGVIHERDLVWINESAQAFSVGVPSPDVIAGIDANFTYLKRNLRRRIEALLIALLVVAIAAGSVQYARKNVKIARAQEQTASAKASAAEQRAGDAEKKREQATAAAAEADKLKQEAIRLGEAARRSAQEEQGQRASLLAAEPGREHDALLAGVLGVGPGVVERRVPPSAAMYGVTEAVAAAGRSLPMAAGWTHAVRMSDDGQQFVTLGTDGIRWWQTETGRLIRHVSLSADTRAAFCGDSGLIVSGSTSMTSKPQDIRFWDFDTGRLWTSIRAASARGAACSQNRKSAVLFQNGIGHLWNLRAKQDLGVFPDELDAEPTPQFSGDGTRLISGRGIFEIPSRRLVAALENPILAATHYRSERGFRIIRFFGGDQFVAGASAMGNVVVWKADDGTVQHNFEVTKPRVGVHYLGTVERVHNTIDVMTISPDGKHIAVADIDNRITIWSTTPGQKAPLRFLNVMAIEDAPQRLKISSDGQGQPNFGAVTDLRFFDDSVLVFITETGRMYVYHLSDMGLSKRMAIQDPQFATGNSALKADLKPAFTFDRHGRAIVTSGCFAGVRRWAWGRLGFQNGWLALTWQTSSRDMLKSSARLVLPVPTQLGGTAGAAFSSDNRVIVTEDDKGRRSVWDRQGGVRLENMAQYRRAALGVLRQPNLVYREPPESVETVLRPGDLDNAVRSPGGRYLANCCPAMVWDLGDRRRALALPDAGNSVQFAPDEKDLVVSTREGFSVYSLDPAWYLQLACTMLREGDRQQASAFCTTAASSQPPPPTRRVE